MLDLSSPQFAPYRIFYFSSMLTICESVVRSVDAINRMFSELPRNPSMEDVNRLPRSEILGEMQNIIIQGAALSRYFWPVRESHASRGQYLRDALEIGEDSPLKSRDLRNAIEHFDERLDRYLSQGQFGIFVLDYVGPRLVDNGIAGHTFRAFYMGEEKFKLLDKEYELNPLLDEITRVGKSLFKIESNVRCN